MHALAAPALASAALLVLAGAHKLTRPAGTAQALRTQGLPSSHALVRVLGAAELVIAALVLAEAPSGLVLLACAYAGFTGFVLLALLRDRPLSSCGCLGESDTPPSWTHVAVTAALAGSAAAAATGGGGTGAPSMLEASAATAGLTAAGAALVAWLAWLALVELPALLAAAGELTAPAEPHDGPQLFSITTVRSTAP